jgi:hypothetical protein
MINDNEHAQNEHAHLKAFILKHIQNLRKEFKRVKFFGGWVDNNKFCVDLTRYYKNKATALNTARLFNQKAIFDISKQESIYLK